ncbi:MAG TPA: hypothetical protein VIH12_00520 [Solibacillus sp.]
MNQQEKIKDIMRENLDFASNLSVRMVELEVVQSTVANLLERIDEVVHKGWDKDAALATAAIAEIRNTVRLVDMGFRPLFDEMTETVNTFKSQGEKMLNDVTEVEPDESNRTIVRKL